MIDRAAGETTSYARPVRVLSRLFTLSAEYQNSTPEYMRGSPCLARADVHRRQVAGSGTAIMLWGASIPL